MNMEAADGGSVKVLLPPVRSKVWYLGIRFSGFTDLSPSAPTGA